MRQCVASYGLVLAIVAINLQCCDGQLTASLDTDNFIVLEATDLDLLAVEFRSPSGSLIPSEVASPFQGVIVQDDSLALYYNLGDPFVLDGSITLATQWDPTKPNDILFQYGTPTIDRSLTPILGHSVFASQVSEHPVIIRGTETPVSSSDVGIEPLIVASAGIDGVYFYSDAAISIDKLNVLSADGLLSVSAGSQLFSDVEASPFEVRFNASSTVDLEGDFFLPVVWSGRDLSDIEISLTTNHGTVLSAVMESVRVLPEPKSAVWMPLLLLLLATRSRRSQANSFA